MIPMPLSNEPDNDEYLDYLEWLSKESYEYLEYLEHSDKESLELDDYYWASCRAS